MSQINVVLARSMMADVSSPPARHVLLVLAIFANGRGFVTMSVAEICRHTSLCDRTVQRALASLTAAGHLTRYARSRSPWTIHLHPKTG